jgi:hypothetical protein
MLVEFSRLIKLKTGLIWNPVEWRIGYVHAPLVLTLMKPFGRCLAHIINIATQKLISAYSKSSHFDAHEPTAHIPDTSELMRNEIGLVRAISVKVCVPLSVSALLHIQLFHFYSHLNAPAPN